MRQPNAMWMPVRSDEREYMDDHEPEQEVVDKVYRFLKLVNRRLGGTQATIDRFEGFSRLWKPAERIEVLDIASGAADLPRALIGWGQKRGFDVRVTAFDTNLRALNFARRDGPPDCRLRLVCADVHRMPCRDRGFDYVVCALFFHHLTDHQIIATLRAFDRVTRRGIVVNDLAQAPTSDLDMALHSSVSSNTPATTVRCRFVGRCCRLSLPRWRLGQA